MGILLEIPVVFGLSIEVYFILAILGAPFYFLFRYLFKKRIANKNKRIIITWATTVIVTPILYALLVASFILISEYYPNRDFNKQEWLANKDTRYEYSKDIIKSKMLIGKTKAQVRAMLGDDVNLEKADSLAKGNDWYYGLGFRPVFLSIDPDYLLIQFKNGKAVNVEQGQE